MDTVREVPVSQCTKPLVMCLHIFRIKEIGISSCMNYIGYVNIRIIV